MVNHCTSKSGILLTMREAPTEFIEWFSNLMKVHNFGIRDAARFIGVSHPTITRIVTYHEQPSCDTCMAIANAFNFRRELVLRKAGWLKPIPESDDLIEQILLDMGVIPIEFKRTAARMVRAIREEAEEYRTYK